MLLEEIQQKNYRHPERGETHICFLEEGSLEENSPDKLSPEEDQVPKNIEISLHYINSGEVWNRNKIVVDNVFSFEVALDITRSNDENEPQSMKECQQRNDWPM